MKYAVNQVFADEYKPLRDIQNKQIVVPINSKNLKNTQFNTVTSSTIESGEIQGTPVEITQISEQILKNTTGAAIQANIEPGMVEKYTEVDLMTTTTGSSIWFTLNGPEPMFNTTGSSIWLNPMEIKNDTIIQARVYKDGQVISDIYKFEYMVKNAISLNVVSEKAIYRQGEIAKFNLQIVNRKSTKEDVTLVVIQKDEKGKVIEKTCTTQNIKSMAKSKFEIKTKVLSDAKEIECYMIDNVENQNLLDEKLILTVE